jgi:hypothetical protein
MNVSRDRKEVGIHSGNSGHSGPIARLRARFGIPPPAPAAPSQAEPVFQETLDSPAVAPELPADLLAELRREVNSLMDTPWEIAWTERVQTAKYADIDAVRHTAQMMLDLAAERHRAGDIVGFQSWRRFIIRHVRGEFWDDAGLKQRF